MKKWIRWQGAIAFICVAAAIYILFFLFADLLVKKAIEAAGTEAVGAVVELADVDLSLFPAGLELAGLQVTNPDAPMTNAVQIEHAGLTLETIQLLRRKIIVREMTVKGVMFNTRRERSGAVRPEEKRTPAPQDQETPGKEIKLPSFDIKDVRSILEKEPLLCLDQMKQLEADIGTRKEGLQDQVKSLPDEKTFKAYEKRLKQLKSGSSGIGSLLNKAKDASALKKDVERDIGKIKQSQRELKKTVAGLGSQVKKMSQCPSEDFKRIKEKYGLSPQGLGNMTKLIFGPKYSNWIAKAIAWYEKLSPMLDRGADDESEVQVVAPLRGKGRNIRFGEEAPLPDFLIRQTDVSMTIPAGRMAGSIQNITPDQDILGAPLTWAFAGNELKNLESVAIKGVFDHIVPGKAKDGAQGSISGYGLNGVTLSEASQLPLALDRARLDGRFDATIQGDSLNASMAFQFNGVRFSKMDAKNPGMVKEAVYAALSDVNQFSIQANVKGTLTQYDIDLASDLDRVLKNAVSGLVKKNSAKFEKQLKSAISAKTAGPMSSLQKDMKGFDLLDKELTKRLNMGSRTLGSLDKLL